MAKDRVANMAAEVLSHCKDSLSSQGLSIPDRSYVCHGLPPVECCAQLTCGFLRLGPKLLGRGDPNIKGRFVVAPVVQFSVELWRPWPIIDGEGDPVPGADELSQASLGLATDAWAMWSWLTRLWIEHKLFANELADLSPGATPVQWESLMPLGPQGGRAGFKILFTVDIPAVSEAVGA